VTTSVVSLTLEIVYIAQAIINFSVVI